jgi:hypothetical protein
MVISPPTHTLNGVGGREEREGVGVGERWWWGETVVGEEEDGVWEKGYLSHGGKSGWLWR